MPQVNAIYRQFQKYPPLRVLLAKFLDYRPATDPVAAPAVEEPPEYEP